MREAEGMGAELLIGSPKTEDNLGHPCLEFPLPCYSIPWHNSWAYQISTPGIPTSLFFFLVFPLSYNLTSYSENCLAPKRLSEQ